MTFVPIFSKSPTRHLIRLIPKAIITRQTLRPKRKHHTLFALATALPFLLPLSGSLSGCGGGGGGNGTPATLVPENPTPTPQATATPVSTPTPTPAALLSFEPNYVNELAAARHWEKSVVTVSYVPPAPDSLGVVHDVAPLVQQAVELWNQKINPAVRLEFVGDNTHPADITVQWTTFTNMPVDAVGRTDVTYRSTDEILSTAKVQIEASLPDTYQVQVIAHELGHSLGIDGHSTNAADLMYGNAHLPATVTTRDQNTILWTYQEGRSVSRSPRSSNASGDVGTKTTVQYLCGADCGHRGFLPR
jgi:hypothetical protein